MSCSPNFDVIFSQTLPWEVALSLIYQHFDFALKSPIVTTTKEIFLGQSSKVQFNLIGKFFKLVLCLAR